MFQLRFAIKVGLGQDEYCPGATPLPKERALRASRRMGHAHHLMVRDGAKRRLLTMRASLLTYPLASFFIASLIDAAASS